jgi:hypothetical protein
MLLEDPGQVWFFVLAEDLDPVLFAQALQRGDALLLKSLGRARPGGWLQKRWQGCSAPRSPGPCAADVRPPGGRRGHRCPPVRLRWAPAGRQWRETGLEAIRPPGPAGWFRWRSQRPWPSPSATGGPAAPAAGDGVGGLREQSAFLVGLKKVFPADFRLSENQPQRRPLDQPMVGHGEGRTCAVLIHPRAGTAGF